MKPLALYDQVATQFNIVDAKRVHPRQIRAYVGAQVQEQGLILNRLIIDAAKARLDISESKDDTTKAAYESNLAKYENDLRQMSRTLDFFIKLDEELAKEYPEETVENRKSEDGF